MQSNSKSNVVDYERALLGSLIVNKEAIEKIKGLIQADDFFDEKNRIIYQSIDDAAEKGFSIELAPIIRILKEEKKFEKIGGEDYLDFLISEAGLESNILQYCESIVEKSRMRDVVKEINAIQETIKEKNISPDEILERVEMDIISSSRENHKIKFKSAKEVVEEVLDEISKKITGEMISGIPTEFQNLDKITGGLHKGDLIILAARPSMGKTAFALNLATNISKENNVAFFSIEMPSKSLMSRIIGFTGHLPSHKIQKPETMTPSEHQKLTIVTQRAKKLKLYLDDSPGIKLSELIWKAKRLKKNKGLDIIFIDYLQLITVSGKNMKDNRQQEVSIISRSLKKLARELEVPVVALSQLSRSVEKRESKIPMMSDLRESGAIEQDADLVTFLYRDAYYNRSKENKNSDEYQKTLLIIGKHRNGATGNLNLSFSPKTGLFLDVIEEEGQK